MRSHAERGNEGVIWSSFFMECGGLLPLLSVRLASRTLAMPIGVAGKPAWKKRKQACALQSG